MALVTDIVATYRGPGRVVDRLLSAPAHEGRALAHLMGACILGFISQWPVLARRALRHWLTEAGDPPDAAAIERVLAVARGDTVACELPGGRRVERSGQRFRIVPPGE